MPGEKHRLMLMIALALPGAAHALGLGEIHVASVLNQPLVAEISIVGATADDLAGITASVADHETFLRFGADRPEFLSSATLQVSRDVRGRPVLALRTRDACAEPLVTMYVDLRWPGGELIRQYSLLLDPAGSSAERVAEPLPRVGAAAMRAAAAGTPAGIEAVRKPSRVRSSAVAGRPARAIPIARGKPIARGTAIARDNAIARNDSIARNIPMASADPERAAPPVGAAAALDRRVQLLEDQATLLRDQLALEQEKLATLQEPAVPAEQAPAQTGTLQAPSRHVGRWIAAALALAAVVLCVLGARHRRRKLKPTIAPFKPQTLTDDAVEATYRAVFGEVKTAGAPAVDELLLDVHREAELSVNRPDPPSVADTERRERAGVARILDDIDTASLESSYIVETGNGASDETVVLFGADQTAELPPATMKIRVDADADAETLLAEALPAEAAPAPSNGVREADPMDDTRKLDYNLGDTTVHHVQMPSALHEAVGFKERRTSLVDVLKRAIEREPGRNDLRMKLIESYYAAAATNRQGFLEVVEKLAAERGSLPEGEWQKIASMGRHIAPDCDLFAPAGAADEDLADCA